MKIILLKTKYIFYNHYGGFDMDKLSQEYILTMVFNESIDREELLLKKYDEYYKNIKDSDLKDVIKEFKTNSKEHIKLMKDKMIMLNIKKA